MTEDDPELVNVNMQLPPLKDWAPKPPTVNVLAMEVWNELESTALISDKKSYKFLISKF